MPKKTQIKLNKELFWDVDLRSLDPEKNKDFIIGRVLMRGDLNDLREIKKKYDLTTIISTAKKLRYLDRKTFNFISVIFKIPRGKFLCTKRSLANKQNKLWNR